jgi:purine nucleosidase
MTHPVRPLLIDTDPGVDDAFAILMCLHDPAVHVVGLSVCGGNVGLQNTVRNARRLANHAQAHYAQVLPVYQGAASAILEAPVDAAFVHGSDGFGDAPFDAPIAVLHDLPAALAIIEHSHAYAGALEILALGPLTNVAIALLLDPTLPERVARLTIMGGSLNLQGNINAYAEFNFAVDPEAAAIVLQRFPALTLVDWSQTQALAPSVVDTLHWFHADSANARLMRAISHKTEAFKRSLHNSEQSDAEMRWEWADPLAAHIALLPSAPSPSQHVEVLLAGAARGASVINSRKPVQVGCAHTPAASFWRTMQETLVP